MQTGGHHWRVVGVAAAAWLSLCAGSSAQATEPPPIDQTVRLFDFEEPGNPDPVPERWFRAQDDPADTRRAGFPAFNRAEFDASQAVSGTRSVRLPTRGGSTTLRLMPGELAVFPDADYSVVAQVKTSELRHARAFVSARLLDQRLAVIPGSEVRSAPVVSPGVWTPARVTVPGRFAAAAWLQVDLEVLQPAQFAPAREGDPIAGYRVWHEDVDGGAWFDDVSVGLLPRTRFEALDATGILMPGQTPALTIQVRDLGGRELRGVVRVLDVDGVEVWRREMSLQPDNRSERVVPRLPGYGWFRAVLEVSSQGRPVSRHEAHLVNLPARAPRSGGGDWDRAGINADRLPEDALPAVVETIRAAGTRFVVLPAADPSVDAAGARAALQRRLPSLSALLAGGQQLTLAVTGVPARLASERSIDPGDILAMSQKDPETLLTLLEPTLDVLGQRIARYQLGTLDSRQALRTDPSAGASALERVIARLAPGPMIALPWRAEFMMPTVKRVDASAAQEGGGPALGSSNVAPGPVLDALSVRYPLGFPAWGLQTLAERGAAEAPGVELTIVPELPDAAAFGERARATEAARRIVEFWRCMGDAATGTMPARIALDHPWSVDDSRDPPRLRPGVEIAVLAGVMDRLEGRRMVGPVPSAPGVRAYLFAARRGGEGGGQFSRGMVVAWNESAGPDDSSLDLMRIDRELEVFDTFGNRLPPGVETPGTAGGGLVRIALGESPVFVEHVDPYLTMFAASLRLEPGFVPAVVSEHEHRILVRNPWPIRLTGRLQIKQNEGDQSVRARSGDWTITPSVTDFSVGPGETESIPLTLAFGPGQLAGSKDLWIVARAVADRTYPAVRVKTTLEVGLPDLDLVPEVQLSQDGRDVIVLAIVTNKDSRPRSLRVETAARDVPSQQAQVSDLPPGQTVNKRFVFRGAARTLSGQRILVALSDSEGASRLNRAVTVP